MKYGEVAAVVDGVEIKFATKTEAVKYSEGCQADSDECPDCEPLNLQSRANWRRGRHG